MAEIILYFGTSGFNLPLETIWKPFRPVFNHNYRWHNLLPTDENAVRLDFYKKRFLGVLVKVATKCYGGTTLCHHLAVLKNTNGCVLSVNLACYLSCLTKLSIQILDI